MDAPPGRAAVVEGYLTDLTNLSIIVPVLNEEATIASFLRSLQSFRQQGAEVVLVDGGSDDQTCELARPWVDRLQISKPARARQMNTGAETTCRNLLCFLHADTCLPVSAAEQFRHFSDTGRLWGFFNVRLSGSGFMLAVISRMVSLRSRLSAIATGDQALFMTRQAWRDADGFPDIPLMEDVAMADRLKQFGRPYCIAAPVITSSRRWEKHGVWRTILLMWKLRWQYYRGVSPDELFTQYYGKR